MQTTVKEVDKSLSFAHGFLEQTREDMKVIARSFFTIGFRLNEAEELGYVEQLGYTDIYELALNEFGFERTTTKNLMAINRRYCENRDYHFYTMRIDPRYENYSQSQLVEMLPLKPFEIKNISPSAKIAEIRDFKKIISGFDPLDREQRSDYLRACNDPMGAIREFREKEAAPVRRLTEQVFSSDVAPGQLTFNERTEQIEEFHQFGGESFGQTSDQNKQKSPYGQTSGRKHVVESTATLEAFSNKCSCEKWLDDENNYTVVLHNNELNLTIRKHVFKNGLILFRTESMQYWPYPKETRKTVTFSLVDEQAEDDGGYYTATSHKSYCHLQHMPKVLIVSYLMARKKALV